MMRDLENRRHDIGLLFLRLSFSLLILCNHGWGKVAHWADRSETFADPLGIGSTLSLTLAAGAEFGCAILVALGLATRLATIPLIITMAVVVFLVHGSLEHASSELALVFLFGFTSIGLLGPGRYALDHVIAQRRRAN